MHGPHKQMHGPMRLFPLDNNLKESLPPPFSFYLTLTQPTEREVHRNIAASDYVLSRVLLLCMSARPA
jgi:hypothetical protein